MQKLVEQQIQQVKVHRFTRLSGCIREEPRHHHHVHNVFGLLVMNLELIGLRVEEDVLLELDRVKHRILEK